MRWRNCNGIAVSHGVTDGEKGERQAHKHQLFEMDDELAHPGKGSDVLQRCSSSRVVSNALAWGEDGNERMIIRWKFLGQ